MEAFQGAAYPWFRVAEFNYNSFMIRHLAAERSRERRTPERGSGVF